MEIFLVNPNTNARKAIKAGVSWVYLFFGGWALLFQGRWMYIAIELVLDVISTKVKGLAVVLVIYHIFLFFSGNKSYARHLVKKGWQPADEHSANMLNS